MTSPGTNSQKSHWLDAWHVNPSSNREYDFIDGLRGIAILMVLICHHFYVNPHSGPAMHFIGAIGEAGGSGVKLFFVLSGFLIAWPFWKRKFARSAEVIPKGYAWRRFWKIYPPLALSVIVFTIYNIARTGDSLSYTRLAGQWLVGLPFIMPVSGALNPVMWTLVVEVQFYMLLPLVFLCLRKASMAASLWSITLVFLVVPVVYQYVTGLAPTFYPEINSHFPIMLSSFYLGIVIAGLDSAGALKKDWAKLGLVATILCPLSILFLAWTTNYPGPNNLALQSTASWLETIAFGCLLFYVADPKHPVAQVLCAPWLRWCGIVSYEWYLFHQPIVLWSRATFGSAGGNLGKYLAIIGVPFLVSTILAALVYRYFSLPILKYGRAAK